MSHAAATPGSSILTTTSRTPGPGDVVLTQLCDSFAFHALSLITLCSGHMPFSLPEHARVCLECHRPPLLAKFALPTLPL